MEPPPPPPPPLLLPPPPGQEAPRGPEPPEGGGRASSRLLASFQYLHVQLAGGAPWGFTLKGGLEHGEPLIVSKVEDGGKAALSQKIRSGDELVNINGTPLYGSRQEALILIKGSYRTLKMIIRRRSVPVIRPHSWHLAKLSEVRTEAATMPYPANAFSLSWHSGCDTSDLSLPWTPSLSRHCSTDQSSSLGSMESLDPPGQSSYYEGSLSPVDQAMDQNKRDSAYSSFSASSTTSDSALRPEETSATEGHPPGPLPDQRYLQTGSEGGEPSDQHSLGSPPASSPRPAPCAPTRTLPGVAKVAAPPPQPPVRQDSLRACHPPPEATRADPLHPHGPWASDTALSSHTKDTPLATDSLPTDQYYLLSSHTEPSPPAMEKGKSSTESLESEEQSGGRALEGPHLCVERDGQEGKAGGHDLCPSGWKASWTGPLGHRHSAPEHLLSAQLQAMNMAPIQEKTHWTVSPLHPEAARLKASGTWQDREPDHATPGPTEGLEPCTAWEGASCSPLGHEKRPRSASAEPASSLPPQDAADTGFQGGSSMDGLQEMEGGPPPAPRKGGLAPHRSAQMRRRSDRFATNLRHEIQWRKAQLQKAKGSIPLLPCGEERVQEREEAPQGESGPDPPTRTSPVPSPPPPVETRLPSLGPQVRRWSSELSIFAGDQSPLCSPGHTPFAAEPRWGPREPERPPKPLPAAPRRGGRWCWSPEHKLQPHNEGSLAAHPETQPPSVEDPGLLLPFADRRKFFEETSRPLSMGYSSLGHSQLGRWPPPKSKDQGPFQPALSPEPQALQGRPTNAPSYTTPPSPIYADFCREASGLYPSLARHRGDCDCWQPPPCARTPCEAYAYCCGERCPSLHQRNLPVPAGCCTHHCHPRPAWSSRCTECCFLAPHRRLEEAGPWQARKEFPPEEWEPPAINRKNSQSMSELPLYKVDFARGLSPFWTHFETHQPERAPFCRSPSTQNLSWDCERPGPATESPAYEEPQKPPLRERAYSESHLCMEPARDPPGLEAAPRGPRMDRLQEGPPQARLGDCRQESPGRAKKKGPPPPRPPPPKWENYRPRRASHHPLLLSKVPQEDTHGPGQNSLEMARQRSQSLPLSHLWKEEEEEAHLPCPGPREAPSSGDPGSLRYYHYGHSWGQTPEWPPAPMATSDQSGSPRPVSSSEEKEEEEEEEGPEPPRWEKDGQSQAKGGQQPAGHQRSPHSPEVEQAFQGAGKESVPPATGGPPPPPFWLNSEELMRDVVGRDRSLAGVLSPALDRMTATEVMGDLFTPSDSPTWKEWGQAAQAPGAGLAKRQLPQPLSLPGGGGTGSPTHGTAGYDSSPSQAEQESKAKKEARELARASLEEEEELDHDLARKKVQLIDSISRKLAVLQEAQQGLQEDLNANASLGREVEGHIKGACKSQEYEKFRLFIGDLDKVVNLLLSLSGRLARVENALESLDPKAPEEEKLALREKKRQLTAQLEDAKELREHVARRERLVLASVSCCLPSEQLQDYKHFVRMKSALAIQQRQLDDKIKLGQEQLRCLRDSLRQETREY